MITITHEIGFAREVADTLVFMDRGTIVECGAPADLIDHARTSRAQEFFRKLLK